MLTLDEVKEYLRLDTDCEDGYLNILILLACEMCENYTRIPIPDKLPADGTALETVWESRWLPA